MIDNTIGGSKYLEPALHGHSLGTARSLASAHAELQYTNAAYFLILF